MCGIQIGGGEWLFGPEITARYGGGLMWIATVAIVLQVFYNIEAGRYALYTGEPIFTGFMRCRPGPTFWIGVAFLMSFGALIPGLSTHGAAVFAAFLLDHPPSEEDRGLVTMLAYIFLIGVTLPVLVGGKIYNTLQTVMTAKVAIVLGFCLVIGVFFVSPANWWNVFSGFLKFGNVPVVGEGGEETVVNLFGHFREHGAWPVIALANIAVLGGFAGYAGGGGLSNATYSNFVRDKGWGMGKLVGAIPSAIGGREITLSHIGSIFPVNADNLRRWKAWWRYILTDQLLIWMPGCFMGMALPALISIQFSQYSPLYAAGTDLDWSQALITADGLRHAPGFAPTVTQGLWLITLFVGLTVLLPSQMAIIEDFARRWTDMIWSGVRAVRESSMGGHNVNRIYYGILFTYVAWSFFCAYAFSTRPRLMTLVIANVNNVALGLTAFHLLWVNRRLLPGPLRPRWFSQLGLFFCGVFYFGLATLVGLCAWFGV